MTARRRLVAIAALLLAATGCSSGGDEPMPTPVLPPGVAADQPVELFLGLARDQDGLQRLAAATHPAGLPGGAGGPVPLTEIADRFGASEAGRAALSARFLRGLTFSATGGFARLELPIAESQRLFGLSWQVATVGDLDVLTAAEAPTVPDDLRDLVTEVLPRNRVLRADAASDDPANLDPASGHPASLDSASLDPASLDSTSLDSTSLDPASLDSTSLDPASLDPASLGSTRLDPANLDPTSLDPASGLSASLDPTSLDPARADPAPVAPAAPAPAAPADPAPAIPADPTACAQARSAASALVADTGLDAVHRAGFGGAGARVSVIAVADVEPAPIAAWLECIGHPDVAVRGVLARASRPPAAANVEGQLDIAAVTLALPQLDTLTLVEAGAADWVGDALATALTDPAGQPQVITTSVVYCERQLTPAAIRLSEYVLAAAVASGTLVVAASGDNGSSACSPGDPAAAVSYPASSPNVLAVGGVDGSGAVWARPADGVASGGGASAVFTGRELPDLAALASAPDLPAIPVCTPNCGWHRYAGTSFAAPFVAGALIAVNQARVAAGRPGVAVGVGGVDRTVDPASVVDVTRGGNDLFDVGCCAAGSGFDQASGWGVPRFDVLAGG